MIRIAICDDDKKMLEDIRKRTQEQLARMGRTGEICTESDAGLMELDLEDTDFDIYLLDIEMPGESGMELAKHIRGKDPDAVVLFISQYEKYFFETFAVHPFWVVRKSRLEEDFPQALENAVREAERQTEDSFLLETPQGVRKLRKRDILYFYRNGKYVYLVSKREEFRVRKALSAVAEDFARDDFIRINRGCYANLAHLDGNDSCRVFFDNGHEEVFALADKKRIMDSIREFHMRRLRREGE
ncbi:MAG: LytTR family DNA-binding domain-containing protein [Lachnospiraceae bacterium]|nr:LytTR family DNA-binding domain-containing protein [Lachnospiraceae bacterium]